MRILLAVDGSPSASRALDLVANLPWPPGSVVRVVAALDIAPALWGGPWIPAIPAGADEYEAQALLDLTRVIEASRLRLASAGLAVETDLLRGAPAFAIPDEASAA